MEATYTYVETLQRLVDLAWPFMDYHAKEEMIVDQFLLGWVTTSLVCKWPPIGTDAWRIFSEWLDRWKLSKRIKSFIPEDTNPAPKHTLSQTNVTSRPTLSNW